MDSQKHSSVLDYANSLIDGLQKQLHGLERVLNGDAISATTAEKSSIYDRLTKLSSFTQTILPPSWTPEPVSEAGMFTSNDFYAAQMVGKSFAQHVMESRPPLSVTPEPNSEEAVKMDLKSLTLNEFVDKYSDTEQFLSTEKWTCLCGIERYVGSGNCRECSQPPVTVENFPWICYCDATGFGAVGWKHHRCDNNKLDIINNPVHYVTGIETWDYITSHNMDYLSGNIVKYVTRYKLKNGLEDLLKAQAYLNKLIDVTTKARD